MLSRNDIYAIRNLIKAKENNMLKDFILEEGWFIKQYYDRDSNPMPGDTFIMDALQKSGDSKELLEEAKKIFEEILTEDKRKEKVTSISNMLLCHYRYAKRINPENKINVKELLDNAIEKRKESFEGKERYYIEENTYYKILMDEIKSDEEKENKKKVIDEGWDR